MPKQRPNTQLFALSHPPAAAVIVRGRPYRLVKVFKHDFFAATALYEAADALPERRKIVIKAGREQVFCGLPMRWIGVALRLREQWAHQRIDGVPGVQRWAAKLSDTAYALEYVEGQTLDTLTGPPPQHFFDRLREMLDAIHARGVAYCDLNKRSNIVVQPDGRPGLIDFQVSVVGPKPGGARMLAPVQALRRRYLAYLQRMDLYHLYKHKRRLLPEELTEAEAQLSRRRGWLVNLHRALVTPVRHLRRGFLARQHRSGRLISPSAHLESHLQPEKATWRSEG